MDERSRLARLAACIAFVVVSAMSGASACALHRVDTEAADGKFITEAEIDSLHAVNALDVIHRLRPNFLASRGKLDIMPGSSPALPNVYVDNQFYGDASALRNIPAADLESIRFYNASEAQYKFGRDNMAGVIGITTKHR